MGPDRTTLSALHMTSFINPKFLCSCFEISQFPRSNLPQIAFVGRSNAGKSSLINKLLNRRNLAKTAKTPGKTRSINFYEIDGKFLFVDLPGFGYAKLAAEEKKAWKDLIEYYFQHAKGVKGVVHLIDIRHGPMDSDRELIKYMAQLKLRIIWALTKADKLNREQRISMAENIIGDLDTDSRNLIICSARDGTGVIQLRRKISELLES